MTSRGGGASSEDPLGVRPYRQGMMTRGVGNWIQRSKYHAPLVDGPPEKQKIGTGRYDIQDLLGTQSNMNNYLELQWYLQGQEADHARPRIPTLGPDGERNNRYLGFARMIGTAYRQGTTFGVLATYAARLHMDWAADYFCVHRTMPTFTRPGRRLYGEMLERLWRVDNDLRTVDLQISPPRRAATQGTTNVSYRRIMWFWAILYFAGLPGWCVR